MECDHLANMSLKVLFKEHFSRKYDKIEIEREWNYLKIDANEETLITTLNELVQDNIYGYLHFIDFVFQKINTPSKELADLIITISRKTQGDHASNIFNNTLISIGERLSNRALNLIDMIGDSDAYQKEKLCGILLGGICKSQSEYGIEMLNKKLNSQVDTERICGLVAVSNTAIGNIGLASIIRDDVLKISKSEKNLEVLRELPYALISFFNDYEEVINELKHLLEKNDKDINRSIMDALLHDTKIKIDEKLAFLFSCATTKDPINIELIAQNLYQLRDVADIKKVMGIFFRIAHINDYTLPPQSSWVLSEFGKRAIVDMANLLLEKIAKIPQEEHWRWEQYIAPRILIDIAGTTNQLALSSILDKWAEDPSLKSLVLETVRRMLIDIPKTNEQFYDSCLKFILSIANREGIATDKIMKPEEGKRIKCAKLIDEIGQGKRDYCVTLLSETYKTILTSKDSLATHGSLPRKKRNPLH